MEVDILGWDCYVETNQNGKTYFNLLVTPKGQYQVDLMVNAETDATPYSVYLPTVGVWSPEEKAELLSRIKQKVKEVDRSAKTEYVGRLSVFVIRLDEPDTAKEVMLEVKQVVEDFATVKV
ncbi:hypothetical protein [Bacillus sp. T33-2]|uniref:hypothetical protein n=1 Tax=Bacillus sp. T33-2 TaxID=2054168 RepID=UPI000C762993|nr:hypothetical protein [Bacillus sp. T33-2]PLR95032.1 hypothetical protein CVD19_15325 [Bacillus sp. T33-2]